MSGNPSTYFKDLSLYFHGKKTISSKSKMHKRLKMQYKRRFSINISESTRCFFLKNNINSETADILKEIAKIFQLAENKSWKPEFALSLIQNWISLKESRNTRAGIRKNITNFTYFFNLWYERTKKDVDCKASWYFLDTDILLAWFLLLM